MPIDLELDLAKRMIYWTDRGDPPRDNTVNRVPMDAPPRTRKAPEIVLSRLMEGIGLALDPLGARRSAAMTFGISFGISKVIAQDDSGAPAHNRTGRATRVT